MLVQAMKIWKVGLFVTTAKLTNTDIYFILYTKINSRWIKHAIMRAKLKILQGGIENVVFMKLGEI